mmetsp:Transcript_7941/g.13332  ORF Transcript_7941/g.13332 Transcript_7941/m.13332 type:complete len:221 (+) Transcript_7941:600-1262(+)
MDKESKEKRLYLTLRVSAIDQKSENIDVHKLAYKQIMKQSKPPRKDSHSPKQSFKAIVKRKTLRGRQQADSEEEEEDSEGEMDGTQIQESIDHLMDSMKERERSELEDMQDIKRDTEYIQERERSHLIKFQETKLNSSRRLSSITESALALEQSLVLNEQEYDINRKISFDDNLSSGTSMQVPAVLGSTIPSKEAEENKELKSKNLSLQMSLEMVKRVEK